MINSGSWTLARATTILLAIGAALMFASTANAGQYTVATNFCDWDWGADGYSGGIMGGCNQGSLTVEQTGHAPVGTYQWWRSNALPPTLNLNTVVYNAGWSLGHATSLPFETRMCSANPYGGGSAPCSGVAIDYMTSGGSSWIDEANTCPTAMNSVGQPQACKGFVFGRFTSGGVSLGGASLTNVRMTIADFTAPMTSTTPANFEVSQGSWLRGTVSAGATATDVNGSGISQMGLTVLDDLPQSITSSKSCYYGSLIPCSTSSSFSANFDTTTVADGPHTARYTAQDAGQMTGVTPTFNFKVDNTSPATPTDLAAQTNGADGWSSNNIAGASWTNTAEDFETTTQSGIASVIVDIEPTGGSQTNPVPVTVPVGTTVGGIAATRTSVSGVTVPAAGEWTLRVQLRDAAGNVSGVGDDTGSDLRIGYDPAAPGSPNGQANGWISRDELAAGYHQEFVYNAPPGAIAPICGFAAAVDQNENGTTGTAINVPGGKYATTWRLPGTLTEATHYVHLRAVSCNGMVTPQAGTNTLEAKVDRTDPVGKISGVENGRWYQDGRQVTLSAVDELSGMAPAPADDPNSTTGAYLSYAVNGVGPTDVTSPRGGSTNVEITGEGQKELRFSPVDFAGNRAAAKVTTFGIDATNPIGHVNYPNPERPTLMTATLGDVPSGVAYAIFSIRPQTGGAWEALPTSMTEIGGGAVGQGTSAALASARFPDTARAPGTYDVRVTAHDQAGNELSTNRYQDGNGATVENPMRKPVGISVRLFKALRTCTARSKNGKRVKCIVKKCTKRSKGTCYKVLRGRVVLVGGNKAVTSEFKRGAVAAGVLSDENGKPLANTDVSVLTTEKFSGKTASAGTATTDENGLYSLRVPAGVSRTVRAIYEGSEIRRPASAAAELATRAKLTLKISKKRAKTGQSVIFSGKVTAYDSVIPSGGKIVALQFFAAKKWRPAVGVAHTDSRGNFRIKYKFDGAKVRAKIVFRIVAPNEDGWGHTFSTSKTKVIRLNF